jgi:hypothetical protein
MLLCHDNCAWYVTYVTSRGGVRRRVYKSSFALNILCRNNELTLHNEKLKLQLADRERTLANIQRSMTAMEDRLAALSAAQTFQVDSLVNRSVSIDGEQNDDDQAATRSSRVAAGVGQLTAMHDALRRIAREVIADCDRMVTQRESLSFFNYSLL